MSDLLHKEKVFFQWPLELIKHIVQMYIKPEIRVKIYLGRGFDTESHI